MINGIPNLRTKRLLALKGGCNFRDIGGYRTVDGRELRWGQVYRSGVLSYFDTADQAMLIRLNVRAICDLRRADEREREPTLWPEHARHLHWEDGIEPPSIRHIAINHPNTAAGMRLAMMDLYRLLPNWMALRLRGMFNALLSDDMPLVVHCAAGKDRTGIAIALLLAALEVPRDIIIEDYLLTNQTNNFEQFLLSRQKFNQQSELGLAASNHPLLTLPSDVRGALFAADADYLNAALEQMEREHGGLLAFLSTIVGLTDKDLQRLRTSLVMDQ